MQRHRPVSAPGLGTAPSSRRAAWAVALMLAAGAGLWGQVNPIRRIKDFRMPEYYEAAVTGPTNQLKSLVRGAEAVPVTGNVWRLKAMQIESYEPAGGTNFAGRAPECLANLDARVASSTGRLELAMAQGRLSLEGLGFWCCLTNNHLIVSNRVRTLIHHSLLQSPTP